MFVASLRAGGGWAGPSVKYRPTRVPCPPMSTGDVTTSVLPEPSVAASLTVDRCRRPGAPPRPSPGRRTSEPFSNGRRPTLPALPKVRSPVPGRHPSAGRAPAVPAPTTSPSRDHQATDARPKVRARRAAGRGRMRPTASMAWRVTVVPGRGGSGTGSQPGCLGTRPGCAALAHDDPPPGLPGG